MIGRQVLVTNRSFTLAELEAFMQEHWDTEVYNPYKIGRPTPVSVEEYILLPATPRFTVIVYPRSAGGLFSKDNKVILTTTPSEEGAGEMMLRSIGRGGWMAVRLAHKLTTAEKGSPIAKAAKFLTALDIIVDSFHTGPSYCVEDFT